MATPPEPTSDDHDVTTLRVKRAVDGDRDSLSWLIAHFTPVLLCQARYRLGDNFRGSCDPEDLVNEVWAVALPKLSGLTPRDGRMTPVVMKFLSTTLLYRYNMIARKRIHRTAPGGSADDSSRADPMQQLAADTRGVVSRVIRKEMRREVSDAIATLRPIDREILILRGVEQNPVSFIASELDVSENAVYVRYHRALQKLRSELADSIFEEFPEG